MKFIYNDEEHEIIIEKKNIKNMYLKVKEDLNIYVTCNIFVSDKKIEKWINENREAIEKMIYREQKRIIKNNDFYFLGNKYDIVYINFYEKVEVSENKIYAKNKDMLEKWLKKETKRIFNENIEYCVNNFYEKIPKFSLKIRKMKTRWGVCNRGNNTVTLNSLLIHYDCDVIKYVIYHELSHFIHPNHSAYFWDLVSKYVPNYKILRNRLKK